MPGADDICFRIVNEFAEVRLRTVCTGAGVRLEIFSTKLGYTIQLDASSLESLTWQTPDVFASFLDHPFGPGS